MGDGQRPTEGDGHLRGMLEPLRQATDARAPRSWTQRADGLAASAAAITLVWCGHTDGRLWPGGRQHSAPNAGVEVVRRWCRAAVSCNSPGDTSFVTAMMKRSSYKAVATRWCKDDVLYRFCCRWWRRMHVNARRNVTSQKWLTVRCCGCWCTRCDATLHAELVAVALFCFSPASTAVLDVGCCYRYCDIAWSVCLHVSHNRVPCKNGWTDQDAIWGQTCVVQRKRIR